MLSSVELQQQPSEEQQTTILTNNDDDAPISSATAAEDSGLFGTVKIANRRATSTRTI
jgi:hypothetical protein